MEIFIPACETTYRKHPLVLVDIGASGGLSHHWKPASEHLRVIGFEPDPREYSELVRRGDRNTTYLNTALFNTKTQLKLYLTRKQEVSSIFLPNRELLELFPDVGRYDVLREVTIDADTLDDQLRQNGITDVDFIKVDTQGSELFILQGARQTLADMVVGVEVEVEFAELYQGQPLFGEVNDFLLGSGFWLFDLRRQFLKRTVGTTFGANKGQLIFSDALYLRNPRSLAELLERLGGDEQRKAKLLKTVAVCALYGYRDYAAELADRFASLFGTQDLTAIRSWLADRRGPMAWLRRLARGPKLGAAFDILSNFTRGNADGWAFSDRKLGNKF